MKANDVCCFQGLFTVSIATFNNLCMCINYKQGFYFSELLQSLKFVSLFIYISWEISDTIKTPYMVMHTQSSCTIFEQLGKLLYVLEHEYSLLVCWRSCRRKEQQHNDKLNYSALQFFFVIES